VDREVLAELIRCVLPAHGYVGGDRDE
jgi:hypothetical protein